MAGSMPEGARQQSGFTIRCERSYEEISWSILMIRQSIQPCAQINLQLMCCSLFRPASTSRCECTILPNRSAFSSSFAFVLRLYLPSVVDEACVSKQQIDAAPINQLWFFISQKPQIISKMVRCLKRGCCEFFWATESITPTHSIRHRSSRGCVYHATDASLPKKAESEQVYVDNPPAQR